MSSEKKPGFWQRLFGIGAQEPPKEEPAPPKPAKKEPPAPKPAQKEPPKQKQPAKKAAKLKAPPPAGPHVAKDEGGSPDGGPKGPKPGGGKRPRKPKSEAPAAAPPPSRSGREGGSASARGTTPCDAGKRHTGGAWCPSACDRARGTKGRQTLEGLSSPDEPPAKLVRPARPGARPELYRSQRQSCFGVEPEKAR